MLFLQHTYGTKDINRDCICFHFHLNILILFMLFYLKFDFYGFNAGFFLVCYVVRVRCDGVRLEFFYRQRYLCFTCLFKCKCHLHMSFLIIYFVAICLFSRLSWPRRKGRLRSGLGCKVPWRCRPPLAARRLGGATVYRSYLVTSKLKK